MSFIQANLDKYTVKQMCSALKFPRSTYYAALNHVPSKREQEYKEFSDEVLSIYNEFKKRYGAIKIHRELNDRNIPCSVKRVQRHMKKLEIKSIVVKKYNTKRIRVQFLMIKKISLIVILVLIQYLKSL